MGQGTSNVGNPKPYYFCQVNKHFKTSQEHASTAYGFTTSGTNMHLCSLVQDEELLERHARFTLLHVEPHQLRRQTPLEVSLACLLKRLGGLFSWASVVALGASNSFTLTPINQRTRQESASPSENTKLRSIFYKGASLHVIYIADLRRSISNSTALLAIHGFDCRRKANLMAPMGFSSQRMNLCEG